MKKLLILIAVVLLMIGCKKEKPIYVFGDRVPVYFSFVDIDGNDLLNPSHPEALLYEFIYLYKLENGEKELVYDSDMDNPKGMSFLNETINSEYYRLGIFDFEGIMILDFGDNNADTISYNKYTGIMIYDGEVVWDYKRDGYRHPIATIVKNN